MKMVVPIALGASVGACLNALLFLTARAAGLFGDEVIARAADAPLNVGVILAVSAMSVVGASGLRLGLGAVVRPGRARLAFLSISLAVLVASLGSPVQGLEGAGLAEILTLETMHLITALAAVSAAEWAARPDWRFGREPYEVRAITPSTALVTGATSGIGAQVARELAARGFRVIGIGRSIQKARALEADGGPTVLTGDLGSMADAARLATRANELVGPEGFGVVVHCAGTLKPASKPTKEGIDSNFATSFLGRFALTRALRLAPGWRLVNVAAAEHGALPSMMRFELRAKSDVGSGLRSHGQAQLANDLWTASLAREGIAAFGYGPGSVDSGIRRELPAIVNVLMKPLFAVDTRTPRDAALDIVRLLLDASLGDRGFASRWGIFSHDPFVLEPARQDALVSLSSDLVEQALAREATL